MTWQGLRFSGPEGRHAQACWQAIHVTLPADLRAPHASDPEPSTTGWPVLANGAYSSGANQRIMFTCVRRMPATRT